MTSWEKLWDAYQRERRKLMEKEIFLVLLQVFPSLLVAQADGFIDTMELQRLEAILQFLRQDLGVSEAALEWRSELRYLAIDTEFWRGPFLSALRGYLEQNPEKYFQQAEFLFAVAAASTGDIVQNILISMRDKSAMGNVELLISEKERAEVRRLVEELGFVTQPGALAYLEKLFEKSHG